MHSSLMSHQSISSSPIFNGLYTSNEINQLRIKRTFDPKKGRLMRFILSTYVRVTWGQINDNFVAVVMNVYHRGAFYEFVITHEGQNVVDKKRCKISTISRYGHSMMIAAEVQLYYQYRLRIKFFCYFPILHVIKIFAVWSYLQTTVHTLRTVLLGI